MFILKQKMEISFKLLIIAALILSIFAVSNANQASATINNEDNTLPLEKLDGINNVDIELLQPSLPDSEIQPYALPAIALVLVGIGGEWVVGHLVDGTISYVTGKAPDEWVKYGLSTIERNIKQYAASASYTPGRPIYVARNGNIHACVVFPCAVATKIEDAQ